MKGILMQDCQEGHLEMEDEQKAENAQKAKNEQKHSSDFTENIDKEVNADRSMQIESAYSNLRECYVSKMGHTRLFTATKYGKRYILKCLKKDFLYTPIYQQALTKEFEIGLQLEHPNICRTQGLERLPDLGATIVMEYIDGETLQSLIDKKKLTTPLAHKLISQLMDALEYMHSKQIIHRDLKPSNIMVTYTSQDVKIIDFGLSDSDAFYVLKIPAGTTGYIAPEQFLPGAKAEPRIDIYSLGMVIADMAAATKDRDMQKLANACAAQNPTHRPESIRALRILSLQNPHEHWFVVILSIIAFALACAISRTYYARYQESSDKMHHLEQTQENYSNMTNGNQVIDYQLWDKRNAKKPQQDDSIEKKE